MEVSVIGAKLNGGHAEFSVAGIRTEFGKRVGVKFSWQR
jgi:hypothetical protein